MPDINDVYANRVTGKEYVVTGFLKEEVHGREGVILDNAKEITYRGLAANFTYVGKQVATPAPKKRTRRTFKKPKFIK